MAKDVVIGKVLSGYLSGRGIYATGTEAVQIGNQASGFMQVNAKTIVGYKDINVIRNKKLGASMLGDILFGTAGALAMGNEEIYTLEITWNNGLKSMISILNASFYSFFISKLYEYPNDVLEKRAEERSAIERILLNVKKIVEKKENQFHGFLTDMIQNMADFKIQFEGSKGISYYSEYQNYCKDYLSFVVSIEPDVDYHKIIFEINGMIRNLKMMDRGNLLAQKMYDRESLLEKLKERQEQLGVIELDIAKDYQKIEETALEDICSKKIYEYYKGVHEKKGFIYFHEEKEIQRKQWAELKDIIPQTLLEIGYEVIEKCSSQICHSHLGSFVYEDTPSWHVLSMIINTYFRPYEVELPFGNVKIITLTEIERKYFNELKRIKNDKEKWDKIFFETLDNPDYPISHEAFMKADSLLNDMEYCGIDYIIH